MGNIPEQSFLDRLTRIDELLIQNTEAVKALRVGFLGTGSSPTTPQVKITPLDRQYWGLQPTLTAYQIKEFDMTTARSDEKVVVVGDQISAATDGTLSDVYVRLSSTNNDRIPLRLFNPFYAPTGFNALYLTHAAQSGKKLYIHVSTGASTIATPRQVEALTSKAVLGQGQANIEILVQRDSAIGNPLPATSITCFPAYTVPAGYQLDLAGCIISCDISCMQEFALVSSDNGTIGIFRYDMQGNIILPALSSSIFAAGDMLNIYLFNYDTTERSVNLLIEGILEAV